MGFLRTSRAEHGPPRGPLASLALIVLLMGTASQSSGNTIKVNYSSIAAGPGSNYTWTYNANLEGSSTIFTGTVNAADSPNVPGTTGDYFAITDVPGLDAAATLALATPAGWVTTVESTTDTYAPAPPSIAPCCRTSGGTGRAPATSPAMPRSGCSASSRPSTVTASSITAGMTTRPAIVRFRATMGRFVDRTRWARPFQRRFRLRARRHRAVRARRRQPPTSGNAVNVS